MQGTKRRVKTANYADKENKLPDAVLKFEPHFIHNDEKHFMLFFLPHVVKCLRNNVIKKDNYFKCRKLALSTLCTLEAGTCAFK